MTESSGAGGEIVCGCFDLTRSELERAASGSSFERFLEETRAGSRCTACLLDVEYLFVNAPRIATAGTAIERRSERRSLKRRLYDLLDRLSPLVPFRLVNSIPLLSGPGIVERLWLVNQPMVFGEAVAAPPHRFEVTVRDADGREIGRERHDLPCGASKIMTLPELPRRSGEALSVGSVEIARQGLKEGVRGTTRPHFEVEAPRSNTTLHVQGSGSDPAAWLTTVHRPEETRILFTAINTASRPFALDFGIAEEPSAAIRVELPPYGARLVELRPASVAQGRVVTYHYRGRGRGKVHVVTASPALDRLALDHL